VAGQIHVERFFGVAAASVQSREYYEIVSNTRLVSRLKGSVLLIYGGIDENVPLKSGFVMVDAFIKADKDVDMLIVPDCAHAVSADPYVIRRSVQYFIEHLAGR
jgi:dipeptidyl aminopeptidase/acylaminoacyl peptidase